MIYPYIGYIAVSGVVLHYIEISPTFHGRGRDGCGLNRQAKRNFGGVVVQLDML